MENLQEKAYFNIGNSEYYEGYYIKENRWNGWARPYFEKCIAELFVYSREKSYRYKEWCQRSI